jgi:hypothetical protein
MDRMSSAARPADIPIPNDFYRIPNLRLMTEHYFDLMSEKYDALAAETTETEPKA